MEQHPPDFTVLPKVFFSNDNLHIYGIIVCSSITKLSYVLKVIVNVPAYMRVKLVCCIRTLRKRLDLFFFFDS
jgi:hypothetical protein